jgi:hypothetical protein
MRWTASLSLVALEILPACNRNRADSAAGAATAFPPFTHRFDGKNGLLTLHHPAAVPHAISTELK